MDGPNLRSDGIDFSNRFFGTGYVLFVFAGIMANVLLSMVSSGLLLGLAGVLLIGLGGYQFVDQLRESKSEL